MFLIRIQEREIVTVDANDKIDQVVPLFCQKNQILVRQKNFVAGPKIISL